MNEYVCTWDKITTIISILTIIMILSSSILMIVRYTKRYKMREKNQDMVIASLIFAYLLPVILVVVLLFMPLKVSLTKENLVVHQVKGDISIPISEIAEIRQVRESDFANGIRTLGSGGLFGTLGKFENPQFDKFQMYVTNMRNSFVVKTKKQVYVFSCKDCAQLINIIKNKKTDTKHRN
jgi:hypothetical protein